MATLKALMAKQTPEAQAEIKARADELIREVELAELREALQISQSQLAKALGVKQPRVAKIESNDNDPRLSTLKRYVEALGGKLSISVQLPDGKTVGVSL